jgi:FKBP-type peptidyl-prolyl cis-trans isomerase SlyD
MNTPKKPELVADDVVVSLDYTLRVNGEIVDSTEGIDPILFIQGQENIIPGLEKQLYGMKIGDTRKVLVAAKDGYGESDPEAIVSVPRDEIPADIAVKPGLELTVRDEDGELMDAVVLSVSKDTVQLDFNHPLAGKELEFEVTVMDLREADPEELEHGHAHGDDGEELEDEEDYDEEDEDEVDYEELDDLDSLDGKDNLN